MYCIWFEIFLITVLFWNQNRLWACWFFLYLFYFVFYIFFFPQMWIVVFFINYWVGSMAISFYFILLTVIIIVYCYHCNIYFTKGCFGFEYSIKGKYLAQEQIIDLQHDLNVLFFFWRKFVLPNALVTRSSQTEEN